MHEASENRAEWAQSIKAPDTIPRVNPLGLHINTEIILSTCAVSTGAGEES